MDEAGQSISYEEFGRLFVPAAVTPERVAAAIRAVAGDSVDMGPFSAGPRDTATVTATGRVAEPQVVRTGDDPLTFTATLPVAIDFTVRLAATAHSFRADVDVEVRLTARTVTPLTIVVDVADIEPRDIRVRVHTEGLRQRVLRAVGNMDEQIRHRVAGEVRQRIESERGRAARIIDIAPLIDRAWQPE